MEIDDIFGVMIRAMKAYDAAKDRLFAARETVTRLNNPPSWLKVNGIVLAKAKDELAAAQEEFYDLGSRELELEAQRLKFKKNIEIREEIWKNWLERGARTEEKP